MYKRQAYHQLGDDGKEARAEKKADYRTGYSEEKKQDVREKNADQHRTAYARLLAEKAEAEAKRREDDANCPAGAGPGIVVVSDGQERNEDGCQKAHHWWPSARWRVSLGRCSARDRENRKARGNSSGSGNGCTAI